MAMSNKTIRLINSFAAGYKAKFIAKKYSVLPTVCLIVRKFKKTRKIEVKKHGGYKHWLFNNEQKMQICSWVDENQTLTLKELVSKAQNAFIFSCSMHGINHVLGFFSLHI